MNLYNLYKIYRIKIIINYMRYATITQVIYICRMIKTKQIFLDQFFCVGKENGLIILNLYYNTNIYNNIKMTQIYLIIIIYNKTYKI